MQNTETGRKVRIAVTAILACAFFLIGCSGETAESPELPAESTEESMEQMVSEDTNEQETADTAAETPKRFQYREELFALGLPVVTEEQATAAGKTLLTLQPNLPNTWLKNAVAGFNRQSADYFIRLEEPKETSEKERLFAEVMAGRGPDIIAGNVFEINEGILKKGILADLAPGLDAMGISDEEYFPSFRTLRMGDGVYGIQPYLSPNGLAIRESVLGSSEQPDIETLVERLYTYPDQEAVWYSNARSNVILEYLLSGSQDLWGMIDWEEGTCDFSGELFARMLEIAKRYADPEGKTRETEDKWLVFTYYPIWKSREHLESEGKIVINYPFDDGNYPAYSRLGDTIMLNASSQHPEGAWEFLRYLLDEEGQCYTTDMDAVVASREMSRNYFAYELDLLEEGRMQTSGDYTSETVEELLAFTEQGRQVPLRTKEILAIIYEEAQTYCDGDKPLEEVCDVIQKKVQIYISENI